MLGLSLPVYYTSPTGNRIGLITNHDLGKFSTSAQYALPLGHPLGSLNAFLQGGIIIDTVWREISAGLKIAG